MRSSSPPRFPFASLSPCICELSRARRRAFPASAGDCGGDGEAISTPQSTNEDGIFFGGRARSPFSTRPVAGETPMLDPAPAETRILHETWLFLGFTSRLTMFT